MLTKLLVKRAKYRVHLQTSPNIQRNLGRIQRVLLEQFPKSNVEKPDTKGQYSCILYFDATKEEVVEISKSIPRDVLASFEKL